MGSKPPQPITSPTSNPPTPPVPGVSPSPFNMKPPITSPPLTQPITSPMANTGFTMNPPITGPVEHNIFTPPGLNPSGPATATPQNDPRAMALRNLFTPNRMGGR